MKMAFQLNDLKGFLFLVLFTIPLTSSTNYDCKGKSFYCLNSTHFLICVDFGGGVSSTLDDFTLPCPSPTVCHESNRYECELPKIATLPPVYVIGVSKTSDSTAAPLTTTATTVPVEVTTLQPSTEKNIVLPPLDVTSKLNKELLERLKDEYTGGNENLFEPTTIIPTDNISSNSKVNDMNTTANTNLTHVTRIEPSTESLIKISVTDSPKFIDVTTFVEGLLGTDFKDEKYISKSQNTDHNSTDVKEVNTTVNELTKSENLTSKETLDIKLPISSPNLNTGRFTDNNVESAMGTETIVPVEVTNLQPSTEKNTALPPLDVTSKLDKELLEILKDEYTGGNENLFEPTTIIPTDNISSNSKVNDMNTIANTNLIHVTRIEPSTESIIKISVTDSPKFIDVTTFVEGLLGTDFKDEKYISKSQNTDHNSTDVKELNTTVNELTKSENLTSKETLDIKLPTLSPNLNSGRFTDNNVESAMGTETIVPVEVTTLQPSTEKNTVLPPLDVTSKLNKELLESLKDEYTGGNENLFEPTTIIPTDNISSNRKVNDMNTTDNTNLIHVTSLEPSTESIIKISVTDSQKFKDVTTFVEGLLATDYKDEKYISKSQNTDHNGIDMKGLNITVNEFTKSKNLTSTETLDRKLLTSLPNLNTDRFTDNNVKSDMSTETIVPVEVTTVQSLTEKRTALLPLEFTSKLNKELLESLKDEYTGQKEKKIEPTTDNINSNSKVNNMNTTADTNLIHMTSIETSTESKIQISVTDNPKFIDVTNFVEGFLATEFKNKKNISRSQSTDHNHTDVKELNITVNELTKSKHLTSKETLDIRLPTSSPNLNTGGDTAMGTKTIVPVEVTTVQPAMEKRFVLPPLEFTSNFNKELLESLKDEYAGGNKKQIEPTTVIPADNTSANNSKVNNMNITADTKLNHMTSIESSTESIIKISVTDSPKFINVTDKYISNSRNIDHNSTDVRGLNITVQEVTILDNLTSKETHIKLPTSSPNLVIDNNVRSAMSTEILVPVEVTTVLPSTEKYTVLPMLEEDRYKFKKEILKSLKDEFTKGNKTIFETATLNSNQGEEKVNEMNTTSDKKINSQTSIRTSTQNTMKISVPVDPNFIDDTTSVEGLLFRDVKYKSKSHKNSNNGTDTKELNITVNEPPKLENLTSDKALTKQLNTPLPKLNTGGPNLISVSEKNANSGVFPLNTEKYMSLEVTAVLPSTEENTVLPSLEEVTLKSNQEILESLKNEYTGGNEHFFETTTNVNSNLSVDKANEKIANADRNFNSKPRLEPLTENIMKMSTHNSKFIEVTTSIEGLRVTYFKDDKYVANQLNISHNNTDATKVNERANELTRSENFTSYKPLAKELPTNNKEKIYDLDNPSDNILSSSQTDGFFSPLNLLTPATASEVTVNIISLTESKSDPSVIYNSHDNVEFVTEPVTKNIKNLNTSNITDRIAIKAEDQKDFLANQSSTSVTSLNNFGLKESNNTEAFVTLDTLNHSSKSLVKNEIIHSVVSTNEPTTNIVYNRTGQSLDVLNVQDKEVNTYRTTVSSNEQTTKVASTTPTNIDVNTTTIEMKIITADDNSITTSISIKENFSTTILSTIIETVKIPDTYVSKNELNNTPKRSDTIEVPIDVTTKSTTTYSPENVIKENIKVSLSHKQKMTPSIHYAVTNAIVNMTNDKESVTEKRSNITTNEANNITTFIISPQSKISKFESEPANTPIIRATENANNHKFNKYSNINGKEYLNNIDYIRANELVNIASLPTEKSYIVKETNNKILKYEVTDPSTLESTNTEPSKMNKNEAKKTTQNTVVQSNDVNKTHKSTINNPTIPTLTGTQKYNVIPTTSFAINEKNDNKPTEALNKLKTISNFGSNMGDVRKVVSPSQNINENYDINLNLTQIKEATSAVKLNNQNATSDLATSNNTSEHKAKQHILFSTTVRPVAKKPTSENIMKVTKPESLITINLTKSDYVDTTETANNLYHKENILTGYNISDKRENITSKEGTNLKTASGGLGPMSDTLTTNDTSGSNVNYSAVVNDSTLNIVIVSPVNHQSETLHVRPASAQLSMEMIKAQTVYHNNKNIFKLPAVTELTDEQQSNIAVNKIPSAIRTSTNKLNTDNSSKITINNTKHTLGNNLVNTTSDLVTTPVPVEETINIQKSNEKPVQGGTIFRENIVKNGTGNNSFYNTDLGIRDKYLNTTNKAGLAANFQIYHKIPVNNSYRDDMNVETTNDSLTRTFVSVDIDGKSENRKDDESSETYYKSASHIEVMTSKTLVYNSNKSVINSIGTKYQTYRTNISDTQTNQIDNKSKMSPIKIKVPRPATNENSKGGTDIFTSSFDCQNITRGRYADSKDCRKFYTCIGMLQPIVGICPNNTVFSEINKQCTRNLSHCVRNNQFHCLYEGRFSDSFKDNIYYICVKNNLHGFFRYKLQCQEGYYLNKATVKCEKTVNISNESASSLSENSKMKTDQSGSTIKSDESEKSVSYDFECKKEGKFPHPNDCRKYYKCSKNKKHEYRRKIKKCSRDEVFDKHKKKCVNADSNEC